MRKLQLKKESLGELTQANLAQIVGAGKIAGEVITVKDTDCGWTTCLATTPINQCLLTFNCDDYPTA